MNQELYVLLSVIAVFAINVAIPGANFVWISKMSLDHGRKAGWFTSLGTSFADMLYAIASLTGLSVLINQQPILLPALGLIGGLWLAYSGTRMIFRKTTQALAVEEAQKESQWPFFKAFKSGLLVNLTNPQSLIFFTAIIVSSLPAGPTTEQSLILLAGFAVVSLVMRGMLAWLFSSTSVRESYERMKKPLTWVSGGSLMFLGGKTAIHFAPFFAEKVGLSLAIIGLS